MSPSDISDEQLRKAVANSTTIGGVLSLLKLTSSRHHRQIAERIVHLCIDTSHFKQVGRKSSILSQTPRWTDDALRGAVIASNSWRGVLRKLGLPLNSGGLVAAIKARAKTLQLSTTHFTGKVWNKGKIVESSKLQFKYTLEQLLIENSPCKNMVVLKIRLIREKRLTNVCAVCGLGTEWQGKSLVLRLDHINGIRSDCRIENLRLLCPNCDSQTPTFTGRNKRNNRLRREAQAKAANNATPRPPDRAP